MKLSAFTKVVTAEQMRALDKRATDEYGIPSILLMENAGRAVFQIAVDILEDVKNKKIVIVAGSGNNGGDGFVAARHFYNAGANVQIFYFGDKQAAKGDALVNIKIAEKMWIDIDSTGDVSSLSRAISESDLVIDALLGTGLKGNIRKSSAEVIGVMNLREGVPLIAVDIPSGVDADAGKMLGPIPDVTHVAQEAVCANYTVTFALPKIGLVTYPGAECVGKLIVADIGIPIDALQNNDANIYLLDSKIAVDSISEPREQDSHKGIYGHLAIVAGSVGMTGAAALAAEAALRIGTGLVTVAVPKSLNDIMEVKITEAMTIPVAESKKRAFGMMSLEEVLEIIAKRDAVVIGPGFGRDKDTVAFALELIKQIDRPALIDADALYALSTDLKTLKEHKAQVVITPHPGEMAMLLGTTSADIQSNRLEVASSFAKEYGVTVVLKGAGTVIAAPDGNAFINTTGTPGMATGGTGDVLSGIIGGLIAQNRNEHVWQCACSGTYIHGLAGELAAEAFCEAAMIASDVVNSISDALKEIA